MITQSTAHNYLNKLQTVIVASALGVLAMFYAGSRTNQPLDKVIIYASATMLGVGVTKTAHTVSSDIHRRIRTADNLQTQITIQQAWDGRNSPVEDEVMIEQPTALPPANRYPLTPEMMQQMDDCIRQGMSKTATVTALNGGNRPNGNKYKDWCSLYDTRKAALLNGGV